MRKTFLAIGMAVALAGIVGCPPPQKPDPKAAVTTPVPTGPVVMEDVKASVGMGKQGRSLDTHEGFVVTPVKALFSAKERIAFEIEVPHAIQLYKATEGQGPQSHEEFMEKIVVFNQIKLPKLPEGHTYIYDPMTEQLMVRRPKSLQSAPPADAPEKQP